MIRFRIVCKDSSIIFNLKFLLFLLLLLQMLFCVFKWVDVLHSFEFLCFFALL